MNRVGPRQPVPMLTILLDEQAPGDLVVRSISAHQAGTILKIAFDRRSGISETVHRHLADEITTLVGRLSQGTDIISLPDYQYSAGGVSVAGVRLFRSTVGAKGRHLQVRFRYFLGSIDRLIRKNLPFRGAVLDHREQIAVETLADITAPMLGLAATSAGGENQDCRVAERLALISERATEIQFFMSLLTRHVRHCADERAAQSGNRPEIAPDPMELPY